MFAIVTTQHKPTCFRLQTKQHKHENETYVRALSKIYLIQAVACFVADAGAEFVRQEMARLATRVLRVS